MYALRCAGCGEDFVNTEPLTMQECITMYRDGFYHMEPCFIAAVEEDRQRRASEEAWVREDPEHHFLLPHEDEVDLSFA